MDEKLADNHKAAPNFDGLVEFPLSWRPHDRHVQKDRAFGKFMGDISASAYKDDDLTDQAEQIRGTNWEYRDELNEYLKNIGRRYVIDGVATSPVRELIFLDGALQEQIFTAQTEQDYTVMMQRFEQELLGLEPPSNTNGLRWWAASAGFASGSYPAEIVAGLVGATAQKLNGMLRSNSSRIIIRADNFLIPIIMDHSNEQLVKIDSVCELTEIGEEYLEFLLSVVENQERDI